MPKHPHPANPPLQLPLPLIIPCVRCGQPTMVTAIFGKPICEQCLKSQPPDPHG